MSLKLHLCIAFLIRIVLIIYGEIMDQHSPVSYTDVDYKVFSDAARYVVNNQSPYKRHTYRYTPFMAYMLVPNTILHPTFGKFLFSAFDLIVALIIYVMVRQNGNSSKATLSDEGAAKMALTSAKLWLYNPLAIVIATRGNGDSVATLFVLVSLLFIQNKLITGVQKYFLSGFFLALAIHLRLYPIVYSFPMYIALGKYRFSRRTTSIMYLKQLVPNANQLVLAFSCVSTLILITILFYQIYGYEFLFESYIYHLLRIDMRHNFSVYFYLLYLGSEYSLTWFKVITFTVKVIILLILSINYGSDINNLNFCILCQTILIVAYNSVMTSQYFIWFLALLPLSIKDLDISLKRATVLFIVWLTAQASWLLQAYLLEFKSKNTFIFIWMQGIAFFAVNLFVLSSLIKSYSQNCRIIKIKGE